MASSMMFNRIAEQLGEVRQAHDPFQRQHIFHSILAYCGERESAEARMDMMYRFSQCQRALGSMLRGNQALADDVIGSIDRTSLCLASTAAQAAMDAMYSTMIAYKYYALRDYATAHGWLERGRESFGRLFDDGMPRAALALVDLELNAVRVNVAAGQAETAVAQTVAILNLLYSRRGRLAGFDVDLSAALTVSELDAISDFFTDALLSKLIVAAERRHVRRLFGDLCAGMSAWTRHDMRLAFDHYETLLTGRSTDERDQAFVAAGALARLPASVQYVIVCAMLENDPRAVGPALAGIQHYFAGRREIEKLRRCSWCDERTLFARPADTAHEVPGIALTA